MYKDIMHFIIKIHQTLESMFVETLLPFARDARILYVLFRFFVFVKARDFAKTFTFVLCVLCSEPRDIRLKCSANMPTHVFPTPRHFKPYMFINHGPYISLMSCIFHYKSLMSCWHIQPSLAQFVYYGNSVQLSFIQKR